MKLQLTFFAATLLVASLFCSLIFAQTETGADKQEGIVQAEIAKAEKQTVFYEVKLKITGRGKASKITATSPFPLEWPEQKIQIVKELKSDSVRKISFKPLTKLAKQMVIKINRLADGEVGEASVIVKAERALVYQPDDTGGFSFAKKVPGTVKQFLRPSPYIESGKKDLKEIAKAIPIDDQLPAWQQVEEIYKWVREKLEYKFDPTIHTCMEAIKNGHGDCEELSSLFIAVCRARGIPARAVWVSADRVGGVTHTYPEFYLEDPDGNGRWLPCQAAGDYQFGEMTDSRLILQKGDRFKLPGHTKPLRYVQPTCIGDAPQGLGFEWIVRVLSDEEVSGLK